MVWLVSTSAVTYIAEPVRSRLDGGVGECERTLFDEFWRSVWSPSSGDVSLSMDDSDVVCRPLQQESSPTDYHESLLTQVKTWLIAPIAVEMRSEEMQCQICVHGDNKWSFVWEFGLRKMQDRNSECGRAEIALRWRFPRGSRR